LRVAILYTELAEYVMSGIRSLAEQNAQVLLIHWQINPEAPFHFNMGFIHQTASRDSLTQTEMESLVLDFNPELILCSGWLDKGYVRLCRKWKSKIPTVVAFDNKWSGSLRQRVAAIISPVHIARAFSHAFVPGVSQKNFALKLGFENSSIKTGLYTADTKKFGTYFTERQVELVNEPSKKRILYLGRYVRYKGIFEMWDAFVKFRRTHPDWELWCVGTGDQFDNRVQENGIKHFGFVQPADMLPILKQTTIYILPSHVEPWGVSVQEMAIAGFPLLLSDKIGAGESFLVEGENGFRFEAGSIDAIQNSLEKMAQVSDRDLLSMAEKSHQLGMNNSPQLWAKTLLEFLN
jgi:glycosyltransferase involved in cell wall biosynthesis